MDAASLLEVSLSPNFLRLYLSHQQICSSYSDSKGRSSEGWNGVKEDNCVKSLSEGPVSGVCRVVFVSLHTLVLEPSKFICIVPGIHLFLRLPSVKSECGSKRCLIVHNEPVCGVDFSHQSTVLIEGFEVSGWHPDGPLLSSVGKRSIVL